MARDPRTGAAARVPMPSQEYALFDYAMRLARHREGRLGVHVHLSRLQPHNRREHHIRVAINTFEQLVKQFEGQLFVLHNADMVFICRGAALEDIEDAVMRLRYLFSEDPLTRFSEDRGDTSFCSWYVMERDHPRFLAMARRFHEVSEAQRQERLRLRQQVRRARKPLDPATLAHLETALAGADITAMVRNQSIAAVTATDVPRPVFEELYVSIDDVERALAPEIDVRGDPWLFQRLTAVLDRRMLTHVMRDEGRTGRPFSVNLNVATILSPDFQQFDLGIGLGVRGRLVIEVQKADIFQDMGAYIFARDFAQDRGYRMCLDGMTHLTLPFVDRERLGLDLVKIFWGPELSSSAPADLLEDLDATIKRIGPARMVMCRCDSEDAVRVGRRLGITLFQGRHIDTLISGQRPPSV